MANYRPYRQCAIAHKSIVEYMQKYMPHNPGESDQELLIKTLTRLNQLSSMIKAHPEFSIWPEPGIHRNSFYTLKDLIVYFMFTISNPIDTDEIPENEIHYRVRPRNIYTTPVGQKLYELAFDIDGTEINITTVDNRDVSPGYLPEFFNGFTSDENLENTPEADYSQMTSQEIIAAYDEFIDFLLKNNLFFTMFKNTLYIEYVLNKYIFKNSLYMLHIDPTSHRAKLDFFGIMRLYVYRFNKETKRIECAIVNGNQIRTLWTDPEVVWQDLAIFAQEHGTIQGHRTYIITDEEYMDIPMYKDMVYAVDDLLSAAKKRKLIKRTFHITNIIQQKNKNER